jgi:hypothetical protein
MKSAKPVLLTGDVNSSGTSPDEQFFLARIDILNEKITLDFSFVPNPIGADVPFGGCVYYVVRSRTISPLLNRLLEEASQLSFPLVVELPDDDAAFALRLVNSGAFWVVAPLELNLRRVWEVIQCASIHMDARRELAGVLIPETLLDRESALNVFVSRSYEPDNEDSLAFSSAITPLRNEHGRNFFFMKERYGGSDLRSSICRNIADADCFLAFLSPTGKITDRIYLDHLIASLSRLHDTSPRASILSELDGPPAKVKPPFEVSDLIRQSPNVMWEMGYAYALGKPMILIEKATDGTAASRIPALVTDAARVKYVTHTDLALQLHFGLLSKTVKI